MKAKVIVKDAPTALLYNIEDGKCAAIMDICAENGIRPVVLDTISACMSVGCLCGAKGFSSDMIACDIPQNEAMVLYAVGNTERNALLDGMRARKLNVDLKCVATATNMSWALGRLVGELEKEHKAMHSSVGRA